MLNDLGRWRRRSPLILLLYSSLMTPLRNRLFAFHHDLWRDEGVRKVLEDANASWTTQRLLWRPHHHIPRNKSRVVALRPGREARDGHLPLYAFSSGSFHHEHMLLYNSFYVNCRFQILICVAWYGCLTTQATTSLSLVQIERLKPEFYRVCHYMGYDQLSTFILRCKNIWKYSQFKWRRNR